MTRERERERERERVNITVYKAAGRIRTMNSTLSLKISHLKLATILAYSTANI
jgi:hypothetical protein